MSEMPKAAVRLVDLIRKDDPIVKYEGEGAALLKQISKPVLKVTEDIAELVAQMKIIMHAANGVGLAAPQLGILQRIIVYDVGDNFHALVNPKILQRKGTQIGLEGCLSIPGLQGDVERAAEVVVKGLDEQGKPVRIRGEGLTARVLQHEIDHLDGILFIDRNPQDLHYVTADEAEAEEKSGTAAQTRE